MPQNDAGPRIEPPVSEPSEAGTRPAASAAPEPLDEPPVKCSRFHGLRAGGHGRSNDGPAVRELVGLQLAEQDRAGVEQRCVVVASAAGMLSRQTFEPPEVRMPGVL